MKNIIFSFGLLISLLSGASAQEEIFKVLASKGTNKVMTNGSTEAKPLLIGKKLFKGDKLVLSEGCYLGLAHKSGKTIELKKSGTYEVSKLGSEVMAQNATLGKKYLDYVVSEMTAQDEDMAKNRHKYMAVTGSVERGLESIKLIAPANNIKSFVITAPTTVRWNKLFDVSTYEVKIMNLFDELIYSTSTSDTMTTIDLSTLNKSNVNEVQVLKVCSKNNNEIKSTDLALNYIGGDKGLKIKKDIQELKKEMPEESALNQLVLASFYEENKMYLDAMEAYMNAMKIQPEVDDYKVLYGKFLLRTGIGNK
ncbi:MAG: hypothetical protein EAZ07_03405 [Cytophagales bacterium]|nr:MAG: hypothetical protein EAZ07_03405 [Cytophagales bacterium]